jgi:hypothetical protein
MDWVERRFPRCVVRRIDDFFDFWGEPFQHNVDCLSPRHLRGLSSLAATAHANNVKLALQDLQNRIFAVWPWITMIGSLQNVTSLWAIIMLATQDFTSRT